MTVMLLIVSVLILVFGLAATTRTQNITVGGYYSGVIVSSPPTLVQLISDVYLHSLFSAGR